MITRLLVVAFLVEAAIWVAFGVAAGRRCIIMLESVKESARARMGPRIPLWVDDEDFEHPKGLEDRRLYGRHLLRFAAMIPLMFFTIIVGHAALKAGI